MKRHYFLAACLFSAACSAPFFFPLVAAHVSKSRLAIGGATSEKRVVVKAAGRGNPYINFEDGVELSASYTGASVMQGLLKANAAEPRALASADFDEDGVPDLICGYARAGGGIITLHRGNVDSIFPNSPEAQRRKAQGAFTDSAFLSPASVFEAEAACDFVGAGDFDADGHWDVVIAARGGKELWMFPGDGKGSLLAARKIALTGAVTSLITGEINRADGLTDVVVGVVSDDGPKALVFEGPDGALRASPEIISMPAAPTALALGQLDDDYPMDLAVGAGSELFIIHGRDRKLSFDEIRRATVPPAQVERRTFDFEIRSIAAGDFRGANETGLAVLATDGKVCLISPSNKQSSQKGNPGSAEVIGQWDGATQLLRARVSTGLADDLLILSRDQLRMLKTGISANPGSSRSSTIRVETSLDLAGDLGAVLPMSLNTDALADLVLLQAGQDTPFVVKTAPIKIFTVTNTNSNGLGSLAQAIVDSYYNLGPDKIVFNIPGPPPYEIPTLGQPLNFSEPITIDGTTQPGFDGTPRVFVRGYLSGGGWVFKAGNSLIQGIGLVGLSNDALVFYAGGYNIVRGCYIGIGNGSDYRNRRTGISIEGSSGNTVGGTATAARNVISQNGFAGVYITDSFASQNLIQGNYIGTNIAGTDRAQDGQGYGVLCNSSANTIGGLTAGAGNVISKLSIFSSRATGILVQGNRIGTDATGTIPLIGNLDCMSTATTVGGTSPAARNIIASGGMIVTRNDSFIQGNFIGTDITGTRALGAFIGISVGSGTGNLIGGTTPGARNVISGNMDAGILIRSGGECTVSGNYIGTDASGTGALGNGTGISFLDAGKSSVGGGAPGAGNIIAFNPSGGVSTVSSSSVSIRGNSIFSNGGPGIDLGSDGVTPNDPCDSDSGANNLQNFPVLTSATFLGSSITVQGSLNSTAHTVFSVDFFASPACDASGFGEGKTFIGSTTVTTAANCIATFNVPLAVGTPVGQFITATATDSAGNTSEFSQCVQVQPSPFDLCLQDESNGNILLINSITGEYQFSNCGGLTLAGFGSLTKKGCQITLQVNGADRRILARIDTCLKSGTASIQIPAQGTTFTILDRNTANNTCACASGSG